MRPQGTGWIPDHPDARDYGPNHKNLAQPLSGLQAEIAEPSAPLPPRVDLREDFPPVVEQGPLNSCTAATAAALIGYFEKKTFGWVTSPSILFLYKVSRNLLGQRGDTGAFLRTAMQALRAFGVPPEKVWPYNPALLDVEPAPFHYAFAANFKATHYFRLDDGATTPGLLLRRVKAALSAGIPPMYGMALFDSLGSAGPGEIPLPGSLDVQRELHALVAVGYDDAKTISRVDPRTGAAQVTVGALRVRNSWGTEWGTGGYGWVPYDYILAGLTSDWWCLLRADSLDLAVFRKLGGADGNP
jgi:C1A family cysteine protease